MGHHAVRAAFAIHATLPLTPHSVAREGSGEEDDIDEIYELLAGHYVTDADNMFKFAYDRKLLRWALTPPCVACCGEGGVGHD